MGRRHLESARGVGEERFPLERSCEARGQRDKEHPDRLRQGSLRCEDKRAASEGHLLEAHAGVVSVH